MRSLRSKHPTSALGVVALFTIVWAGSLQASPVWSVATQRRQVAFTFDDGPKPEYAIPLLKMLDSLHVPATFFIVGHEASTNIDLVKEIADRGHEVANHTYTHTRLPQLSPVDIRREITQTNSVISRATNGVRPRLFRPPGGQFNTQVIQVAEAQGMTVILWDVNAGDYILESGRFTVRDESRRDNGSPIASTITKRIMSSVKPGSIILMHNGGAIIDVLPRLVAQLRTKGYEIVTVGELMKNGSAVHTGTGRLERVPD